MLNTENASHVVVVGYPEATITKEFYWCICESMEDYNYVSIMHPDDIKINSWCAYIVSVTKDLKLRKKLVDLLDDSKVNLCTYVHRTSTLTGKPTIGRGSFIGPYAGIYYDAVVGDHCIIGPTSTISHVSKIGRNTILHPGTIIAGDCTIGSNCLFGMRTTVVDHISVCEGVETAAASLITKNLTTSGYYVGSPARLYKN